MTKRKLFLVCGLFWLCAAFKTVAQTAAKTETSTIAIVLNEYSASNTNGAADAFGRTSDWVEIWNNNSTFAVSLNGYYLSNDRKNLFKWKFPSSFTLPPKALGLVWLSGKNTIKNGEYHANFTLEQCKNQWLILSTSAGVIRDSVFIQPTKDGHSRGRIDPSFMGINAWRLYTSHSQLQTNPTSGYYKNYAPTPKLLISSGAQNLNLPGDKGGFNVNPASVGYFKLNGITYDTLVDKCFLIYYTTNGDYPSASPSASSTSTYYDSLSGSPTILFAQTSIFRFIAVPNYTFGTCGTDYLESFCETNTYFVDPNHQNFKPEFGIVSLAVDSKDTAWFSLQTAPKNTTVHVEYYDKMNQVSEGYGIINQPVQESWRTKQKGFYIDIDDERGSGCNFEGPIFNVEGLGVSSRTVFPSLHLKGGDIESNSGAVFSGSNVPVGTGLRDVFIQSLAAKYKLNVNPLHIKPVNVFVNAKYWGVYDLREIYDKYYENYYNKQSLDSLDMLFYHKGVDGSISYPDGSFSQFSAANSFSSSVYSKVLSPTGLAIPLNSPVYYNSLMAQLDKSSFIDYMILNSFCINTDIWDYNIAFARGGQSGKPGNKWHYYLWNMPAIFNYTSTILNNPPGTNNVLFPPCFVHTNTYPVSKYAGNSHGMILNYLFKSNTGNSGFQLEYKNRYQDLLNGPLKCDNLMKHWTYINNLYLTDMKCHTDPACIYGTPQFGTVPDAWDTLMYQFQKKILDRCDAVASYFGKAGCYGVTGPYAISVNIEPEGAGTVKLNTTLLETYPWTGKYYQTVLSFKAIPTNTTFVFDHWKFKNHTPPRALSLDSVSINFANWDDVVAVFTDKSKDITANGENANMPTGFTPNGDGINDWFRPLGSGEFANDYQITIWNRWGEEVYRSTNPTDIGWDGNFRGQQAITGVYAYIITYRNIYGESKIVKGNVTLTR